MPKRLDEISIVEARRISLAAQGFDTSRPKSAVTQRHLTALFARLGVVQIDSVNVLVRSQELPLFSRLGNHDRTLIPNATKQRKIFEYWGHEAAHLPVEIYPLFRWKMEDARTGKSSHWGLSSFYKENRKFVERIFKHVATNGSVTAKELSTRTEKKGTWWDWDEAKTALEYLFLTGQVMSSGRGSNFARIYDIPDRVLPQTIIDAPTPNEHDARKELLVRSAYALGVATMSDLADYFRQKPVAVRSLIRELIDEGTLHQVSVESWNEPAFMHRSAKLPKAIHATTLLSPFDSLVWCRPRNERLFNFHYRIEIYTPKEKRKFGYYVLPLMVNGEMVGRVDLKADRASSTLLVHGVYCEPGAAINKVAAALAVELREMADWLSLGQIKVGRRGNGAQSLGRLFR
ncbi:MAG: winged helix-turn-helix domain-containing protein [Acidimicrobiaceae bacterium]|nr:winged helix-turn-helix domain-containing protein [Acidimicrobiaceae bacterium]